MAEEARAPLTESHRCRSNGFAVGGHSQRRMRVPRGYAAAGDGGCLWDRKLAVWESHRVLLYSQEHERATVTAAGS
uniref:Uncharacterized protein n=1 Tax=Oryza sativa subsp. indica TaxID=39946 RepID=A0A679BBK8_ORYSI|nr:hypothetical protein [Oryza sativa Indica Group]